MTPPRPCYEVALEGPPATRTTQFDSLRAAMHYINRNPDWVTPGPGQRLLLRDVNTGVYEVLCDLCYEAHRSSPVHWRQEGF